MQLELRTESVEEPSRHCGQESSRLNPLHRSQNLQPEAFVGRQDTPMGLKFAQRGQGHAKIHRRKRTAPHDALLPTFGIGNFLDLVTGSRVKGGEPIVPANVAFSFGLGLEPRVAQLETYRMTVTGAEPIKNETRVHLREVMISHLGSIGRVR